MKTKSKAIEPKVVAAAATFVRRKLRLENPEGHFDNAGRWYPTGQDEEALDANAYRSPSRAWPYSYLLACRTAAHCAAMHSVDVSEVRKAANKLKKQMAGVEDSAAVAAAVEKLNLAV